MYILSPEKYFAEIAKANDPKGGNAEAFSRRVLLFGPEGQKNLIIAYRLSRSAHSMGEPRESGEPYFNHPYTVACVLMDSGVRNWRVAVVGLLHDVIEDTTLLSGADIPGRLNSGIDLEVLGRIFGSDVKRYVDVLTKFSERKFKTKEEREKTYAASLRIGPKEVALVKGADVWNNLCTLQFRPLSNQLTTIDKTCRLYLPILENAHFHRYKEPGEIIVNNVKYRLGMEAERVAGQLRALDSSSLLEEN